MPEPEMTVPEREVLVVAATRAWDFYQRCGGYVCRTDRPVGAPARLGFYLAKEVRPPLPRVLLVEPSVPRTAEEAARRAASDDPLQRRVGAVLALAVAEDEPPGEDTAQVVVLSPPDDAATLDCGGVRHEGPLGWVRSRRWSTVDALTAATTTDDLRRVAAPACGGPPPGDV